MFKKVFLLGAAALLGQAACLGTYDKTFRRALSTTTRSRRSSRQFVRCPRRQHQPGMQYGDRRCSLLAQAKRAPRRLQPHARLPQVQVPPLGQVMADLGVNMTAPTGSAAGVTTLVPLELALKGVTDPTTVCNNIISTNPRSRWIRRRRSRSRRAICTARRA